MAVNVLKRWAAVPVYSSAQILSKAGADICEILIKSSARDLDRDGTKSLITYKAFRAEECIAEYSYEPKDDIVYSLAHEFVDGQTIVLRSYKDDKADKKRRFVERWSRTSMLQSVEVTNYHDDFNTDNFFGRVSFHAKIHSRIAYVAEKKKAEDKTYKRFDWEDDWGSALNGTKNPSIVVLDFNGGLPEQKTDESKEKTQTTNPDEDTTKGKVIVLKSPENFACGEAVFVPDQEQVVFTGTSIHPRRYGLYYCMNRRASIMQANYDGTDCRDLTPKLESVRSPNFGRNGHLYFLSNPSSGAHWRTSAIHRYNPENEQVDVVYEEVQENSEDKFGLYNVFMRCLDTRWLVLDTTIGSAFKSIVIEIKQDGTLELPRQAVKDSRSDQSWITLGSGKGQIITSRQDPDGATELRHIDLASNVSRTILEQPSPYPNVLKWEVIRYPSRAKTLESILLLPEKECDEGIPWKNSKPPVLIDVHGGPHAASWTKFSAQNAALLEAGVALLRVNYTGSIGHGQAAIDALIGRCGDLDISQTDIAREELVATGLIDTDRVGVIGGSHGGFIAGWVLGRYPKSYKCGIIINPVMNMGTVGANSDIPDWAQSEAGFEYDLNEQPLMTPDRYKIGWDMSPVSVIDKVEAPTLMMLGGKDLRVPNYEGKNWVARLRARGLKNVECLVFPEDGHALDSAEAFKGSFEATIDFMKKHL